MSEAIKTALMTGGAKRLGREIALTLAGLGWDIAIHWNTSEAEARRTEADVIALGRRATRLKADLSKEADAAGLVGRAVAALGPVTLLVNNASVFECDELATVTRESWDLHMETNLRAPFVLSQHFARLLPKALEGSIVNILDQRVFRPTPKFMSYSLSRAGLHWLTKTMAQALAPQIRVNAIAPGPSFIGQRQDVETFERQKQATPLGRGAIISDLLGAVSYLVEARSVTGQTIAIDSGQHIAWQTPDVLIRE